jgi:2,5-diketo-D-gluconate reductase A
MTPVIQLNDGTNIPQIGFGTLQIQPDRSASPENVATTARIVGEALDVGYRHIDTAQSYGTEKGIGRAIAASGVARRDLYITSKLANGNHRADDVRRSFDATLDNLGLDQLDLFLIHWPLPTLYDGDYVSTWKAMTALLADGRLRSAGVSNFQPAHLDRIIEQTGVVPAVNQIEVHPYFANREARETSTQFGIAVEAWSPLGQGALLDDQVIRDIAARHGRTAAQVVLRWHIEQGHIVIPRSVHRARMEQNIDVLRFELTPGDMAAIDSLDKGERGRIGPHPDTFDWIPR